MMDEGNSKLMIKRTMKKIQQTMAEGIYLEEVDDEEVVRQQRAEAREQKRKDVFMK